jgi:hypothetical protein
MNPNFDLLGNYQHCIISKSELTCDDSAPNGRAFVHETDVNFDAPSADSDIGAHDIDIATDLWCVFQANIECCFGSCGP